MEQAAPGFIKRVVFGKPYVLPQDVIVEVNCVRGRVGLEDGQKKWTLRLGVKVTLSHINFPHRVKESHAFLAEVPTPWKSWSGPGEAVLDAWVQKRFRRRFALVEHFAIDSFLKGEIEREALQQCFVTGRVPRKRAH